MNNKISEDDHQTSSNKKSLTQMLEEEKKLLNQAKVNRFFTKPEHKITSAKHSLFSLSPFYKQIKYGPPTNYIVDPPSSGKKRLDIPLGEDSENEDSDQNGPSMSEVVTTLFDGALYKPVVNSACSL